MSKHLCDSEFPWCPPDARADDFYKLRVKDLSPTQFAVGKAEVAVRTARLRRKYNKDPGKLHDYLRTRPVPILVRGKKFYLVDHHHLVRVLYDALHEDRGLPGFRLMMGMELACTGWLSAYLLPLPRGEMGQIYLDVPR